MGMNRVIHTAGLPVNKKEKETTVVTNPGEVLMNVVDNGEIKLVNATADEVPRPLMIVDYGSTDGMDSPWSDLYRNGWERDIYKVGDQVPHIYPLPGDEVMVMADTNTTWAVGTLVGCNGDGQVKPVTDADTAIGICLEDLVVTDVNQQIKMEVLG